MTVRSPIRVAAHEYVELLMEWIDVQTSNESIFPLDGPYPDDLERTARHIFKRLFRVRLGAREKRTWEKRTPH